MSNHPHQRPDGQIPPGLSNGQGRQLPPPPPDAAPDLAQAIGQAVAMHLAQVLGQILPQVSGQTACVLCIAARKKAELEYQGAVKAAAEAGQEAPPQPPLPAVSPAVTWIPLGQAGQQSATLPVCYQHFTLGPEIRSAGLVDAAGNPIMVRSAAA